MIWRLVVRPEAEADIAAAALWYEDRQAGLGAEFMAEIRVVTHWIAAHPELPVLLRGVPPVRRVKLRRFPYQIFYYTRRDALVAFAVIHSARSASEWNQGL